MYDEMKKYLIGSLVIDAAVVTANVIEQYLLIKNLKSHNHLERLLISLSLADLLFGVLTIGLDAFFLFYMIKPSHISEPWVLTFLETAVLFTILVSILHVLMIAVERLLAICWPNALNQTASPHVKRIAVVALWMMPLLFIIAFSVARQENKNVIGVERFIIASIFSVVMLFVTCTYTILICFLCWRKKQAIEISASNVLEDIKLKNTRRATFICIALSMAFILCIGPITMGYFNDKFYHHISNILVNCNALINPLVYIFWRYLEDRRLINMDEKITLHQVDVQKMESDILFNDLNQEEV